MANAKLCTNQMLNFFKAGGDAHRQQILSLICKHKMLNVTQILEHVSISQPTLSHHLKILRDAQVVATEKKGKEIFYSLNNRMITDCCNSLLSETRS